MYSVLLLSKTDFSKSESEDSECERRIGKDLPTGLQIRPRCGRTARPLPPYPRRDLYEQGHRRDEVAHPQGDSCTGLGSRKHLPRTSLCRELRLDEQTGPQTGRRGAFENPARLLALHGADHRHLLPAHPQSLHQGAGTGPQLQRRDRDGLGALEERRLAHRPDHRRPRPRTVAHGIRAGAHRRGTQMGRPRRHPSRWPESCSRKGTRRRSAQARPKEELGEIVARATAQAAASREEIRRTASKPSRRSRPQDSRRPTSRARAAASPDWFFAVAARRAESPHGATAAKRAAATGGMGGEGFARSAPRSASCAPCCGSCATLYDANMRLLEHLRPAARELPQLRACCRTSTPGCSSCAPSRARCCSRKPNTSSRSSSAATTLPFIYEKVGNRFERFMIDEFQDTSGQASGRISCRCCRTPCRRPQRPRC